MRIAFFSDIHANLPALDAVMQDLENQQVDALYCLGDLVGYNVWPNEVVEFIRQQHIATIAGNYDEGVGLNSGDCGCAYKTEEDRDRGSQSIRYTNQVITDANRHYLRQLPRHIRLEYELQPQEKLTLLLVHGSPRKINEYLFEDRAEKSLLRIMEDAGADVMLFGHTHKPFHRKLAYHDNGKTKYRHAINIGSVGKPKDGDVRACYLILEFDEQYTASDAMAIQTNFIRVPYNVEQAATAVEKSPLPNEFADMLRKAY